MNKKRMDYELMLSAGDAAADDADHDCSCTELYGGRCSDCACEGQPEQSGPHGLLSDTERLQRIITMMDIQRMLAKKIRH